MDSKDDYKDPAPTSRDWGCHAWSQQLPRINTISFGVNPGSLHVRLSKALCKALDSKSRLFLPQNQLDALTPQLVKEELGRSMPMLPQSVLDDYTTQIMGMDINNAIRPWYPKKPRLFQVFIILVLLNSVGNIASFISTGITDADLPILYFEHEPALQADSEASAARLGQCFNNWTSSSIETFMETQWIVLSPFFAKSIDDVSLYDFKSQIILPFLEEDQGGVSSASTGGYSNVQRIKIHHRHHDFERNQNDPYFALKKLHSKRMADFRREVAALRKFAVSPHSHVVKLLAAFRHGTRFYLLFPWAKGDLCSFWKENTKPIIDKTLSRWTTEQFLGIADALRQVHRDHNHNASEARVESEESGIVDDSRYGYHGDLKPENILQFESGDCGGKHGLLSLSDFGLGRLHGRPQKQVDIRPIGFTPTYRAPELDAKGTIDGEMMGSFSW
ncbi:kinase-like protein [Hypoxylon fuscum]|nr:kinase-like protein [Hypoxylon fuscum]